jgi:AhpC/TSA family
MTKTTLPHPGEPLPALAVALPGGRALRLPDAPAGHCSVILVYRGSWCRYCNAQLRAFQRSLDRLAHVDVSVVALSGRVFPALHAAAAPTGWPRVTLPNGTAVLSYPPALHRVAGGTHAVSAARLGLGGSLARFEPSAFDL